MALTRRELLLRSRNWMAAASLGSFIPGLTLFPSKAHAAAKNDDHFFVMLRTFGGMDVTLGLDPWTLPSNADEQDLFLEYRPEDIVTAAGLKLGPAAAGLAPHAKDCLILNGVMMRRDAGHDVDNLYMVTGGGDGKAAGVAIELGLAMGTGPFGVVVSGSPYLAGKPASITDTNDLASQADQDKLIQFVEARQKLALETAGTPWDKAQADLIAGQDSAVAFMKVLKKLQASGEKIEAQQVCAAAFASGGARQAQIEVPVANPGLDTHQNHAGVHLAVQKAVWNWVSSVFTLFKNVPYLNGSLFDVTTFMVVSEFSRTPGLNAAKGKDHNPFTNSVLFAGNKINGGTVVGASKLIPRKQTNTPLSTHIAWPYDYKKQQLASSAQGASFFFPENVAQTVGHLFNDPANFAPVPKSTLLIPGIMRS